MPQIYIEQLNRANTAEIKTKILLYVYGYKITSVEGGRFSYDTSENETHCFDISNNISNDKIVIQKSIPELPTFDGEGSLTQFGNLRLQAKKIYGEILGYTGQGAIIKRLNDSSVEMYAMVENAPNLMLYKGKIRNSPSEDHDTVTYEVRPSIWDLINKELKTNQYNTSAQTVPLSGILTETTNDYIAVTSPYQRLKYHHPIIMFNEWGEIRTISQAEGSVDILKIELSEIYECSLGKHTLEWVNEYTVKFSTPSTGETTLIHTPILSTGSGTITLPTLLMQETGIISIDYYAINPQEPLPYTQIKGKKIEFWLSYTVEGNPISIALDLVLRAITNTWNTATAPILDSTLPIDYDKFLELEYLFDYNTLWVNEWNRENDVFSYKKDLKPLQAKNIIQKVLDHVGCQLTYNSEGKISINTNWFFVGTEKLWKIGSFNCGAIGSKFEGSHSISEGTIYKRMELFYGINDFNNNFQGKLIENTPDALIGINSVNDKPKTYTVTLPYYKKGLSDIIVGVIKQYLWKWVQLSHIRLKATVLPQFGLTLDVGDKFIADFTTAPILPNTDKGIGKYFMIYSINKAVGKEVEIDCIATPPPIYPYFWCNAKWCNAKWK
jgi:hypothetical protein